MEPVTACGPKKKRISRLFIPIIVHSHKSYNFFSGKRENNPQYVCRAPSCVAETVSWELVIVFFVVLLVFHVLVRETCETALKSSSQSTFDMNVRKNRVSENVGISKCVQTRALTDRQVKDKM